MFYKRHDDWNIVDIMKAALEEAHRSNVFNILRENDCLSRTLYTVKSSISEEEKIDARHTGFPEVYFPSSLSQEAIRNCSV